MLDIAWPELVVIGAVALVAIPPKDLPKAMHTLGLWAGKARRLMHDVRNTFDQISYEAEVAEKLKKQEQEPPASSAAQTVAASPAIKAEPLHDQPQPHP